MRRIIVITLLVFVFYLLEFLLYNTIAWWLKPQLLILLIIFFNLYLGVRYGLYTAVVAGIIKDSFAAGVFGLNLVAFIVDSYMTSFLRKYIYYRGSRVSRLILVFLICLIDFVCRLLLYSIMGNFDWFGALKFALVPAIVTTLLITTATFRQLRQCVSRLFV